MATNATSTAGTAQFNRTLGEFKRELSQDEVDDFNFITSTDLKKAILQLQNDQKSEKRMQNLGRLSAFLEAMDQFDKVVHVFLNASDYLGFIWGPAKFMLLAASTYSEALNTLLDAYQEIGEHMPLLEQYESHISSNPYLQEIVGLIYKDILRFHRKAIKHFRQRAWKKLFHATWRTFRTDFGAIISNLQSHRRLLDSQAIFVGVQEIMKAMRELHETRKVLDDECKRRRDEDVNRQQLAMISWLSAADSASDHEDALAVHDNNSGSGLWLFEQGVIKDWIYPGSSLEPLLWIHGKPGAGKTILASGLIEQCRRQPNSTVAYFYCKHGDPSRDNFIGLAQSMIFQFTRLSPSLLPFVLESQAASGTNSLRSSKIAKEILATALESFDDLILIIDGLDECIKSQKKEIVCWVRSALVSAETNGSRNLRCCFLSQDDNDTGKLLKDLPAFKITEKHNGEDILRYCQRRANEIGQDFGLSPDDVENLTKCVSTKADGMFLYAKLVMDNLAGQVSKAALYEEMDKLPPDINQVYQRIKHRILEESSPPERKVAKTLLSWLLCAKRPLKWHEIQGAMSLNPEDDTFGSKRRLFKDVKDFCGSLVEVRKGGLICFVHLTAKYFLQNEPVLPKRLEHVNLTRLCFSQLSLASHASTISQECIREYIIRGEYAFTEYSIIYAFDHLLDVLSGKEETADPGYGPLRKNLRKFVTNRVNAPEKSASANKHVGNKLQVFEDENFYNSLKHAIAYHKDSIEKQTKDAAEEEPVLALVQQFMRVRSVLEKMLVPESTPILDSLYGHNLFKCSELRCESFHNGFSSLQIRDRHLALHERIYLCSVPGCSSAMIGFSSSKSLQKHEQDYHNGASVEIDFPWHGKLERLDIATEIKRGNQAAFELWLSQWDTVTDGKPLYGSTNAVAAAVSHSQNRMLEALMDKIKPEGTELLIRKAIPKATRLGNDDAVWIMLKHCRGIVDAGIYGYFTTALKLGKDEIAKVLLKHPSSPFHDQQKRARHTTYMNVVMRYGRYAVLQHILETYKIDASQEDDKGRRPLIAAAEFNRTKIAKYLIDNASCDIWARNKKGDTPLAMAGRQGHSEFISSIYHEDISVELVQKWLRTAQLRNAARNGDDKKVEELLNGGLLHVDEVDARGRSPWLWAVESGHERVVEAFLSRTDIAFGRRPLIDYIWNHKDRPSALHLAALSGNDSIIRLLLQSGKFDNEIDRPCGYLGKGTGGMDVHRTPANIARTCKHKDAARIIEDYQATLVKDEEGTLPQTI